MIGSLPLAMPFVKADARIDSLFKQLNEYPKLLGALQSNPYHCQDERLRKLLTRLDTCLDGECSKPEQWRAKEVADWLALSESRFLHLIKAELGITWRPYLLWRRLICVLQVISTSVSRYVELLNIE